LVNSVLNCFQFSHLQRERDAAPNTADLFEIIRTMRSMQRLKPDLMSNDLIRKIPKVGVCAPSGSNMQRWCWRFLVIKDANIEKTVGGY
jgi:nitroreductase